MGYRADTYSLFVSMSSRSAFRVMGIDSNCCPRVLVAADTTRTTPEPKTVEVLCAHLLNAVLINRSFAST